MKEDSSNGFFIKKGNGFLNKEIKPEDIYEDKDGNCIVMGKKIEANACSMIKDDYKK